MADISKIKLNGTTYTLKDAAVRSRVDTIESVLSSALVFKGVASSAAAITGLKNYKRGWCYKASSNFTIDGVGTIENGDMIICIGDYDGSYMAIDWTVVQNNVDVFAGASANAAGSRGLVPSPTAGQQARFLCGDGTWGTPHGAVEYTATLTSTGWSNGVQTVSLPNLACGGGTVSPIISPTSNVDDYSKIASAVATAGSGVTFTLTSGETVSANISITIVDFS